MRALLFRTLRAGRLGWKPETSAHAPRSHATLEPQLQEELDRVRMAMADAVESTKYIADSAQQAYLEAEPGSRGLIESYYQRYLGFSHAQVSRALEDYDSLSRRLGKDRMREVEQQQDRLALTVADTLLARDHLAARMEEERERSDAKQKDGLRRADLTFCD